MVRGLLISSVGVRVDQAWGLFQVSAVAHDIHAAYYGATEPTGHPADKWGWAVQAALSIKNIPTGPGDSINMQAVYADGASHYDLRQDLVAAELLHVQRYRLGWRVPERRFRGCWLTACSRLGTGIETVKTWGFTWWLYPQLEPQLGQRHLRWLCWVEVWRCDAKALICANFAAHVPSAGSTCNPDFNVAVIGVNTVWTPVRNLAFTADVDYTPSGPEVLWRGFGTGTAVADFAKPAAVYELKDQNSVSVLLRAQRNF